MIRIHTGLVVFLLAVAAMGRSAPAPAAQAAVRQELEAHYARWAQAIKAKDRAALQQFIEQETTPDFVSRGPEGTQTRQQVLDALKSTNEPWEPPQELRVKIDRLTLQGDKAVVRVSDQAEGVTTDRKLTGDASGKPHRLVTRGVNRDTWVRTAAGWKLKRHEVLEVKTTLDGKPFTPPR